MDPAISDGCRLCLDPFAESFTTIDSPELRDQMGEVFRFSIESKQGYCSGVCHNCSYAISQFYRYSEKVRQNQELLNANTAHCDLAKDRKTSLEKVKIEKPSNSVPPETTRDACEPNAKVSTLESTITIENFKIDMASDSETTEDLCEPRVEVWGEEVSNVESKITFENVKIEIISDSEHSEQTIGDTCESESDVFDEEEFVKSIYDESYVPPSKNLQTKRKAGKRIKASTVKIQHERNEEDQSFNYQISMTCDLCGTSAATFKQLLRHFWEEHNRSRGYVLCCNKKLFKQATLQDHIDYHANPNVFRCEICGTSFKEKATLKRHLILRHRSEDHHLNPFKCDQCPQSFKEKSALTEHMKLHIKVRCVKCSKVFRRKSSLNFHLANQLCLDGPVDEHKSIEEQRFQCRICQRWLKTERNLRNHMHFVHAEGSKKLQCDICSQKYKHIRTLQLHKKMHSMAHAMSKPQPKYEPKHECEFCGKKFMKSMSLKEHRTIHTGEILYTCDYCGVPKNCKSNLSKHIKQRHPTEWAQKKLTVT